MNLNKYYSYAFLILSILIVVSAPQNSLAVSNSDVFEIVESSETRIVFALKPYQLNFEVKAGNRADYYVPSIDGFQSMNNPGKPQLPMCGILVGIPEHANPAIELLEIQTSQLKPRKIYPAPSLELSGEGDDAYLEESFSIDEKLYSSNGLYPEKNVIISSIGYFRGHRIARIEIRPIQYNPATDDVEKIEVLKFAVYYNHTGTASNRVVQIDPLDLISRRLIKNYPVARNWKVSPNARQLTKTSYRINATWYTPDNVYYKLAVDEDGIYGLDYACLDSLGLPVDDINPQTVKIYLRGEEIPLYVKGEEDTAFDPGDYIAFYGERNDGDTTYYNLYSDENIYWLTWGNEGGLRMQERSSLPNSETTVDTYMERIHLEEDNDYHHGDNSIETLTTELVEGEGWIWKFLYGGDSQKINFITSNIANKDMTCMLKVKMRGTTRDIVFPDHHIQIFLNGDLLDDVYFDDTDTLTYQTNFLLSLLEAGENEIEIKSIGDTGAFLDQVYLDWIEVKYPRKLYSDGEKIRFNIDTQEPESLEMKLWNFNGQNIKIFDLKNFELHEPNEILVGERVDFKVVSAGVSDGDYVKMYINEQKIMSNGPRGHNLAVIDDVSGELIETKNFDTHGSTSESDSMAAFIQRIPNGKIVLAGIRDEGSRNMTEVAYIALESLGSKLARNVNYRDSWALIGRKGANPGSASEKHTAAGNGFSSSEASYSIEGNGNKYFASFIDSVIGKNVYLAVQEKAMKTPNSIELFQNTNLNSTENGADYLIISHKKFFESAQRLAEYRRSQYNIRTKVVDIKDIYDEFNYGIVDPKSVKEFLQYANENWETPSPSYLVLFGDASWDFKKNFGDSVKINYVPSYGSPVSDNWFVCFDGPEDFLPDMVAGRIPVENEDQAEKIVDKIIAYDRTPNAKWKKNILFITGGFDKGEQATFISQSNYLINEFVHPPPSSCNPLSINKTTEGYITGEKRDEILNTINKGVMWLNFVGHAGSWTWDLMFSHNDVEDLSNQDKYPFITSMTCHTGRFANPEINSFGETFLLAENKGAIGFWGTTGWGYVFQDNILLKNLFKTVLIDTNHYVGDATTYSKLKLWENYGASIYNISTIHQYTLLGDPISNLTLAEKPDLTVTLGDVDFRPPFPAEEDSIVSINIKIQNWGLATEESLKVNVNAIDNNNINYPIANSVKIPPIGLTDSLIVDWPIVNKIGQNIIRVVLDPENSIDEVNEQNNSRDFPIYIYSTKISVSKPFNFQVINYNDAILQINNPFSRSKKDSSYNFQFEVDTTYLFNSDLYLKSPVILSEKIVTKWKPPNLLNNQTYFWKCNVVDGTEIGKELLSSFTTAQNLNNLNWLQISKQQFLLNEFHDTFYKKTGVQNKEQLYNLKVESAGYPDGNFARIYINFIQVFEQRRGQLTVIVDPSTGHMLSTKTFDTWQSEEEANALAEYISSIEDGNYVLVGIKDEASLSMTESAYQALESIGSQYCRDVGFRDSWAIIGVKGAPIGSVKEQHVPATQGFAAVEDTLINYRPRGTMISTVIGPSNGWNTLTWEKDDSGSGTHLSLDVLGFNKKNSVWDTLLTGLSETSVELSAIDPVVHPKIKLQAALSDDDGLHTPVLKNWAVSYEPVSDPAIAPEVVSVNLDTLLEGDALQVLVDVHNVGMAPIDSVLCRFSSTLLNSSNPPFKQEKYVSSIAVDSFRTAHFVWNSTATAGRYKITVEIDPEKTINELTELNNYFSDEIVVLPDTTDPGLVVTYDGKHIMDGDFISNQPTIIVSVYDDSRLQFKDDTTRIRLFLNDAPVHYSGFESRLTVLSMPAEDDSTLKTRIRFTPELPDGRHTLEYFIQDASDNLIYHRDEFRVTSELQLVNVMNFPNPFDDHTDFTFYLTKYADRLNIKIYTIAGRLIRKIERHHLEAGFYHIYWDGRDEDRDEIANGVYLYKIIAKSGSKQVEALEKLVIMR